MTEAHRILSEQFGYSDFRPGQKEVITALCESRAALAVFPTGGGKSLCYELLALMWSGVTLVVSPLIALMKNQIDYLRSHGISAARMDSSLSQHEAKEATSQMNSGALKLLYVRDRVLLDRLRNRAPGSTIIYVTLQKTAERVASMLEQAGYPAGAYHAGMETEQRTEVQEWWMASDRNIVVATIAFGMGIDKASVRYVYHYNLPKSLESYSQEIGRAGRDGARSTVELLASAGDVPILENFSYGDTPSESALRRLVSHLKSQPAEFDLSLYELSVQCDIRQLVLRTALTYMELRGILRQHTPFYGSYRIKTRIPACEIAGKFQAERARFVAEIFRHAREGRTWYTLDIGRAAQMMNQERSRVVRALEYLEQ